MTDDVACVEVVELLTEYLEGALPAAEAARIERHLETCPVCTEYLAQLRSVAGSLRDVGGESLPSEVRAALIAAFRDERL